MISLNEAARVVVSAFDRHLRAEKEVYVDWSFIIIVFLGVLGAALVAGGVVAYRGSTRVRTRAFAAAAVAAGITLWALLLWITPVSVARGG